MTSPSGLGRQGPGDCGTGTAAYDEDNYDCIDQLCVYTGCNFEAECQESNGGDWTCVEP